MSPPDLLKVPGYEAVAASLKQVQGGYTMRNMSGQYAEDLDPRFPGLDYRSHSDSDNLRCVDSFQNSSTIKRLSLKRRPKAAGDDVEKPQRDTSTGLWNSAEALSASSSDDTRLLGMSTSTRGRPPLPPPLGSSSENKPARSEASATSQAINELKPKPATRSLPSQKQSPMVGTTNVEAQTYLDQEVSNQLPPQPRPRRRLASFGGMSSSGSLSPFTGLGAYNHNNNGNKPSGSEGEKPGNLTLSLGSRGSTGCLRMSPQSSGRSTPVAAIGPMHLQHVRDQMVVALQRLKELEEQVKVIPILQVKISVLQEEKRQLVSQLRNLSNTEVVWKRCSKDDNEVSTKERIGSKEIFDCTGIQEAERLTEEVQALQKNIQGGHWQGWRGKGDRSPQDSAETGVDSTLSKQNKCVFASQVETRSKATQVSEVNLGIHVEREAELEARQLTIGALEEKICGLEAELKESALQTEMSRLKLELQAAGARNRVDKASVVKPCTSSRGVEARPHTTSQGVGDHTEVQDASVGHATELKTVLTGPDVPMSHWEIRPLVKMLEKCVGTEVTTTTQGVGAEVTLCDADTNTEEPGETQKGKITYRSVACGDCSVDVVVCEAKKRVSRGTATDPVRSIDLGVMASPKTASQRTNTESASVSRFTNTRPAFSTDSFTNTLLSTKDKHTNTCQTVTRATSVVSRVRDVRCGPETRTIGVRTSPAIASASRQASGTVTKVTRDAGVGFTNVNDNFLIGLKTRNMASGPSHLPDPITTRSVGVGEGRLRDLVSSGQSVHQSAQSQWDSELNHYIETMQRLLGEHGDLLTEDPPQQDGVRNNKAEAQGRTKAHESDSHPAVKAKPDVLQQAGNESEVKRMIQMLEQQANPDVQGRASGAGMLRSVRRKPSGDQTCSNRKSMKFIRVTTGLDPKLSHTPSTNDGVDSEEVEEGGGRKQREASQEGIQPRRTRGGSTRGSKANTKQRFKLSKKVSSACQVLKLHLSDDTALSSRELQDCVETLQDEWFSVSSHKSASPDTVDDYLSAFRVISPSVLEHVANMADSNGNTALHYSVSHSSFGIVKKLLDAEVCNVDQQNKAGYTPIMLAALAAVDAPEDMRVVEQLFSRGDVNAKASQAGQTALMLAVSHGRADMVQALLARGAQVDLQDDEGSTALMCASEHGHADIVKLLLSQPACDAGLTDSDDSTALSIALEAGHHDIAMLLYAHTNFSKGQTGATARRGSRSHSSSAARNFE